MCIVISVFDYFELQPAFSATLKIVSNRRGDVMVMSQAADLRNSMMNS